MPITPNMNIITPVPGTTPGPGWATTLNDGFTTVDSHNHATGNGVKITPAGLNINTDLPLNDHLVTSVGAVGLTTLPSTIVTAATVNNVNGDLYWTNGGGTPVQITSGSSVQSSSSTVSRNYDASVTISANTTILASGTVSFYKVDTTSANQITLPAASAVASGRFYEFVDSTGLCATNNITFIRAGADTMNQSATNIVLTYGFAGARFVSDGVSNWSVSFFNGAVQIGTAQIANNAITTAKIADAAITTIKIADGAVTKAKQAALAWQLSAGSSGSYFTAQTTPQDVTNMSVTIASNGRPVIIALIPDGTTNFGSLGVDRPSGVAADAYFYVVRGASTVVARYNLAIGGASGALASRVPPGCLMAIDQQVAGSYTYKIQAASSVLGVVNAGVYNCRLIAYEL